MNQKQRDVLCRMLEKEAEKLSSHLSEKFPLLNNYGNIPTTGITRYSLKNGLSGEYSASLSPKQHNKYRSLYKKQESLKEKERALDIEWDSLVQEIEKDQLGQIQRIQSGKAKLSEALRMGIIQVQFAEDAGQVEEILKSLPSIDQLLGK